MDPLIVKLRVLISYIPWLLHLLYYQVVDPCQEAGKHAVVGYAYAIKCYNSFPLTYDVEIMTLETLGKASSIDAQGRDITAELEMVRAKDHLTEHGFQRDLMKTYNQFQDSTYRYTSTCFSSFEFVQPFPVESTKEGLKIVKYPHHPSLVRKWRKMGLDVESHVGSTILRIGELSALEYIKSYALSHVGTSQDPHARLALTLARTKRSAGKWVLDGGAFLTTRIAPMTPYLDMLLRRNNSLFFIKAPYLAISPTNFNSRASFRQQNCLKPQPHQSFYSPEAYSPDTSIFKMNKVSVYKLGSGGVLKIEELSREDPKTQVTNVLSGLKALKNQNTSSLIIDLSDTTGDGVCTVKLLLKSLFNVDAQTLSHLRHNAILELVDDPAVYSLLNASRYLSIDGKKLHPSLLKATYHYRTRSRRFTPYTQPFVDSCPHDIPFTPNLMPDKFGILTNNICFGPCHLLVTHASHIPGIKFFNAGGFKNHAATLASNPDFDCLDLDNIISKITKYNGTSRKLLTFFPLPAKLSIPSRQFVKEKGFPLRFDQVMPHHQVIYPTSQLPTPAWETIFNLFL
ncbi:hypothetical protein DSO57_1036286 [Entomophthora muscae]|uniref:Uncharacterized protein n=1 Tax=Entomophthora muscae TaxID=34485 RepID=A0ACC2T9Z0_9FUNG|nr:hypothetical protein DSO57_1036286 [Entomophthora muscae]